MRIAGILPCSFVNGEGARYVIFLQGCKHHCKGCHNPETWDECFYKGWETAEEYLTGNLMRKWQSAFNANMKYKHYFDANLKAIGDVLPNNIFAKALPPSAPG